MKMSLTAKESREPESHVEGEVFPGRKGIPVQAVKGMPVEAVAYEQKPV